MRSILTPGPNFRDHLYSDRSGSIVIQFSDVAIRRRNLLRGVVEPHKENSQITTDLFKNTHSAF